MLLVQPQNVPAVDLWLADVPTPRARFDDFTHSRWRRAKGWKERSIADEALILLGALLGVAYIRLIGHACGCRNTDVVTATGHL